MKVYDYWRSGASFRVRIALNLKNISAEQISIHLSKDGGMQHSDEYKAINPQELLPTLITEDGHRLTQSMAILEYLDEIYPEPALLPADPIGKAHVRSLANIIAADTHPIQNLRVLQKLKASGWDQEQVNEWVAHWIELGFNSLEKIINQADVQGQYLYGDEITLADIALVPQMVNAKRFGADLSGCPRVVETIERLLQVPAFDKAQPQNQPDAEV